MDYVVYGTGYGATLMLLGYAVRTWGPGWRFRPGEEAAYNRQQYRSARSSWMRFTTGLGAVIATAGAVLVLATFLLMAFNPGNDTGGLVSLIVTGLMLVGVAVWSWLYFDKFGAWGVVAMPNALSHARPARSDAASREVVAARADDQPGDDEEPFHEDELLEIDEDVEVLDEDDDEFAARSSKFELHHPESESGEGEEREAVVDEARFEAQYAKYESHHPEQETEATGGGESADDDIEEIEEYVEALTPEQVSEDIVDQADEEPVDDGEVVEVESFEEAVASGPAEDAGQDDPLEVIPEAHDALEPLLEPDAAEREEPGGREGALRRLRERQAQRATRRDDDA